MRDQTLSLSPRPSASSRRIAFVRIDDVVGLKFVNHSKPEQPVTAGRAANALRMMQHGGSPDR